LGAAAPSIGGWEPRRQRREEVSGGCLFVEKFWLKQFVPAHVTPLFASSPLLSGDLWRVPRMAMGCPSK
jgi:hypothetical protein